jgi:hypothetical protein
VGGFFARVSRYARPALAEQRENRLSQIFAGVLEHADGLAVDLARGWLAVDPGDDPEQLAAHDPLATVALADDDVVPRSVRTERPTYGGKSVDLELRFARRQDRGAGDIVVWVEVKHGASPHEHQLSNYLRDIAYLGARASAVVLLAPRQSYPFTTPEPPPPEVCQRRWQQTAVRCARWGQRSEVGAVPRFLVDEFLDYLQEESLMDPDVISPVHLVALAEYQRALDGIKLVCGVASGYIALA